MDWIKRITSRSTEELTHTHNAYLTRHVIKQMPRHDIDIIVKVNNDPTIRRKYPNPTAGPCIKEGDAIPAGTITFGILAEGMGVANGLTVQTNNPFQTVALLMNGHFRSEVTSDARGLATFDFIINFDSLDVIYITSRDTLLNFTIIR